MRSKSSAAPSTPVSASVTEVQLLAKATTSSRHGISLYYDGAAILYVHLGSDAATTNNAYVQMGDGKLTYVEIPFDYQGEIRGIWSAAVGAVSVTEFA